MSEGRTVKQLPQNFLPIKKEFQKVENTYWYNKQTSEQTRDETSENLALLYCLLSDFACFSENKQYAIGNKLLDKLGISNDWKILLGEFGKKVVYSAEASWIEIQDMTLQDWEEYDAQCNKEYLNKKK